jgi:hypothetical protein
MGKEKPQVRSWLEPLDYLLVLGPDILEIIQREEAEDPDNPGTYDWLSKIQGCAYMMVRYAISPNPNDYLAIDTYGYRLINPTTNKPFTFSDIGIRREDCKGPTDTIQGRHEMVARVTVALYRQIPEPPVKP